MDFDGSFPTFHSAPGSGHSFGLSSRDVAVCWPVVDGGAVKHLQPIHTNEFVPTIPYHRLRLSLVVHTHEWLMICLCANGHQHHFVRFTATAFESKRNDSWRFKEMVTARAPDEEHNAHTNTGRNGFYLILEFNDRAQHTMRTRKMRN